MPTTRSSSKNNCPEPPECIQQSKVLGQSIRSRQLQDVTDGSEKHLFENIHKEITNCHRCQNHLYSQSLYLKAVMADQDTSDWFWMCENCYISSPVQEQTLCFFRISQNGGLFERESSLPSGINLIPSGIQAASQPVLKPSLKVHFHSIFCTFSNWLLSLKAHSRTYCNQHSVGIFIFLFSFVILLVSIFLVYWFRPNPCENLASKNEAVAFKIRNSFHSLEETFPQQNIDLWVNFASGFQNIAESNEISPAVFLILHSKNTKTSFCIINQVCKIAHLHLKVAPSPLVLDAVQLQNKYIEQGDFILDMEKNMLSRKISVIRNLHMMPGKLAEGLHGLTDAYNPLVKKVIYLMSIPVNQSYYSQNVFELAEDVLHQSWVDVHEEKLDPLLARLTTNVVWIEDEKRFPEYC